MNLMNPIPNFTFAFVLLFSCSSLCLATAADNVSDSLSFEQGKNYFELGNYKKAISIFEALYDNDKTSDNLQYNLAIAYYKNEQFKKAENLFEKLTRSASYSSISFLNLGLIATRRDELVKARDYFQKAIEKDQTGNTSALAKKMIGRIEQGGTAKAGIKEKDEKDEKEEKKAKPTSNWLSFIFLNVGAEDKTIEPESDSSTSSTNNNEFVDFSFFTTRKILAKHVRDLSINLNTFSTINKTNTDSNFHLLSSALSKKIQHRKWQYIPGISTSYMRLGDADFQASISGDIKSKRNVFEKHSIEFRYRASYIDGFGAEYSVYDGTQQKLRIQTQLNFMPIKLIGFYELEKNNRANKKNGSYFYDYSPTRHKIKASIEAALKSNLKSKLEIEHRISQFHRNYVINNVEKPREDTNTKIKVEFSYLYSNNLDFIVEYVYNDNSSSINSYTYTRNQMTLGLQYIIW